MYRVIVQVRGEAPKSYEFLEKSVRDAREFAEEVARQGFWIDEANLTIFIPPACIELIRVKPTPKRRSSRAKSSPHRKF